MEEGRTQQILFLAPKLVGESLSAQLNEDNPNIKTCLNTRDLKGDPDLIIFYIENSEYFSPIKIEILRLKERWDIIPVLLIIPEKIRLRSEELLQLSSEGILQNPNLNTLKDSISTLLNGGRVLKLLDDFEFDENKQLTTYGLGQWLLISGVNQINAELSSLNISLTKPPNNPIIYLIMLGKKRELLSSRTLLYRLWGPINSPNTKENNLSEFPVGSKYKTNLTINDKSVETVWLTLKSRLQETFSQNLLDKTTDLSALCSLKKTHQNKLFLSLIKQLDVVFQRLKKNKNLEDYFELWDKYFIEIQRQALIEITNNYTSLPKLGKEISLVKYLNQNIDFNNIDLELPSMSFILDPLILNKPVNVDSLYLSIDDPRSIIQLEMLISNWIIRTSELICESLISACSDWPELRIYYLNPKLLSTREIERQRNLLNTKTQIQFFFKTPIRIYESKRLIYTIKDNEILAKLITETRDQEFKNLNWLQRQVTLSIEIRDALAPQVQSIIKYIGDLMVIILTRVIGRGIGLVGKGIAQGMGRSLSKG